LVVVFIHYSNTIGHYCHIMLDSRLHNYYYEQSIAQIQSISITKYLFMDQTQESMKRNSTPISAFPPITNSKNLNNSVMNDTCCQIVDHIILKINENFNPNPCGLGKMINEHLKRDYCVTQ
jgi:hypothetical protein